MLILDRPDDTDHTKVDSLFLCVFIAVLAYILYKFLLPCMEEDRRVTPRTPRSGPSSGPDWFPGGHHDHRRPPPPYSKFPDNVTEPTGAARGDQDRLGFWSGAALGSLGTYVFTRSRSQEQQNRRYDWENDRISRRGPEPQGSPASGTFSRQQSRSNSDAGSSNVGSMRRSTGYGGSTVR
jgi:hypothetical protein